MKFLPVSRRAIVVFILSVIITLGIRHFIFTPDSNLLIVAVTFVVIYLILSLMAAWLTKHLFSK